MLTKTDLDLMATRGCEAPGCKHTGHGGPIYLRQRCHPQAGICARYALGSGALEIRCAECGLVITTVAVKE